MIYLKIEVEVLEKDCQPLNKNNWSSCTRITLVFTMLFASEVSVDLTVENTYCVCLSYYTRNTF